MVQSIFMPGGDRRAAPIMRVYQNTPLGLGKNRRGFALVWYVQPLRGWAALACGAPRGGETTIWGCKGEPCVCPQGQTRKGDRPVAPTIMNQGSHRGLHKTYNS